MIVCLQCKSMWLWFSTKSFTQTFNNWTRLTWSSPNANSKRKLLQIFFIDRIASFEIFFQKKKIRFRSICISNVIFEKKKEEEEKWEKHKINNLRSKSKPTWRRKFLCFSTSSCFTRQDGNFIWINFMNN